MIQRDLSERILTAARHFPALVLTGARQVGKTTLLKELFQNADYCSLDLPSLAERAAESPELFLSDYSTPLLIDEIQYAPSLFRHLKIQIDENRHKMGQLILTGSQKFTLMKEVSDSLAGRCAVLELEGLSLKELLQSGHRLSHVSDVTQVVGRGAFPELWRQPDFNRDEFYRSYLSTYLERDVRQVMNVVHLRDFERFIRACAARSGNLLNKSDLARDVGISPVTANEWLSVLEATNQLVLLEPWFGNQTKRLAKSPKLYFTDPGLLCFLLSVSESEWPRHSLAGVIWETFLFAEIRKVLSEKGEASSVWFYRDAQGKEVDFVIEEGLRLTLIESKLKEKGEARDLKNFDTAIATLLSSRLNNGKEIRRVVSGIGLVSHPIQGTDAWYIAGSQIGKELSSNA